MEGNTLLPEILSRVMEYLRDDATNLRSALFVNKAWAAEAIRVLWEKPPVAALAAIGDLDHRQLYARQVRELIFGGDEDGAEHSNFRNLDFPRLRCITIDYFRPDNQEKLWLGQYIQPSMEDFSFYGAEPAEDILHLLQTRCPRLKSIVLGFQFEGLTSSRLIKFFDSCKSITSICLSSDIKDPIDGQLLAYLARHDGLERLELGTFLRYKILDEILEETEDPFRDIRCLAVQIESKAVPLLLAGAKSVTGLTLTIEDSWTDPLPHVSSLVNLQELHISYMEQGDWPGTDFLALKGLKDLRSLNISPIFDPIVSLTLTDKEFIPVFENMSELQELVFQVQCVLSTAAITSLGENCPQLMICEMLGSYDLHPWQSVARPLFPQLQRLELGAAVDGEQGSLSSSLSTRAGTLAHLIVEHAPKLEELHLHDRDDFSKEVVAAFKEKTGNEYNS
ncbi:hypothetical protein BBP40_005818 [Aspergillus hancockii]|nr:hypothetical protein BBP40_005818 [Aspergillus hancockii]